jgi:hypothetical protein
MPPSLAELSCGLELGPTAGPSAAVDCNHRRGAVGARLTESHFKSIQPEFLCRSHRRFKKHWREGAHGAGQITRREAIGTAADERMNLSLGPTEAGFVEIARL